MNRGEITAATKQRALTTLAACNGNSRKAEELLKADGIDLDHSTLHRWKQKDPAEYEKVREEVLPAIRARAAEEHMALSESLGSPLKDMIARLEEKGAEIPARDLPGAIRNVSTARAIERDKAELMIGEPTARVDHRSVSDILRSLKSKGAAIEGEVVSEETINEIGASTNA